MTARIPGFPSGHSNGRIRRETLRFHAPWTEEPDLKSRPEAVIPDGKITIGEAASPGIAAAEARNGAMR
ncbi:MAG: hypothetical protein WBM17_10415 [Anaerolineales bacterium]